MKINKDLFIEDTNYTLGQLVPTLLYSSSSNEGDLTPVTLYDNWSEYQYLEIWYGMYETDTKKYVVPRDYGLRYIKMDVSNPYISNTDSYDGHYWGAYWQTMLKLESPNILTFNGSRGYRFGGAESKVNQWWTSRNQPTIYKVIGWK